MSAGQVELFPLPKGNNRNVTKNPHMQVKPGDFKRLRMRIQLSQEACADLCGVTLRAVRSWETQGAPLMAFKLLHIYDRQDLSGHPGWQGFRFSQGKLIYGKKLSFTPRNLKQVPHYVDVYNRVELARMRYHMDGYPIEKSIGIVLNADAFKLPLLEA
jgi:hypothetical protein